MPRIKKNPTDPNAGITEWDVPEGTEMEVPAEKREYLLQATRVFHERRNRTLLVETKLPDGSTVRIRTPLKLLPRELLRGYL